MTNKVPEENLPAQKPQDEIDYTEVYTPFTAADERAAVAAAAAGAASTPGVVRTPEIIAREIREIKAVTKRLVLMNCMEVGWRLYEVRAKVPHDQWYKWLRDEVDYSERTAYRLMQLYREYGTSQPELPPGGRSTNAPWRSHMSYSKALVLLALPESERDKFVEDHDVMNIGTRQAKAFINEEVAKMQAELARAEQHLEEVQEELEIKGEKLADA